MLVPVWPSLAKILWIVLLVFSSCLVLIFLRKIMEVLFKKKNFKWPFFLRKDVDIALLIAGISALLLLISSFFAPNVLSAYPSDLSQSSNLATTINGLMSPFIAIAAAILTFMAFWVQYTANASIHKENKKQQDERQFYEMLKIHRDNVEKLEFVHLESEEEANYHHYVPQVSQDSSRLLLHPPFMFEKRHNLIHTKGQDAIQLFLKEFRCIYNAIPKKDEVSDRFKKAYNVFFNGLKFCSNFNFKDHVFAKYKEKYKDLCISMTDDDILLCKKKIEINKDERNEDGLPRCSIMDGRKAVLNPYYRHLYLTVKSVVNSDFEDHEKRNFLKILRASLTAEEQTLLLFNWYYGKLEGSRSYGRMWEYEGEQNYFTEWKMIHNIVKNDFKFVEEMSDFEKITKILIPNIEECKLEEKTRELFDEY